MKKLLRVFVLALVLCAALAVSACAASFTPAADSLNEMGLFQGGDNGYDLDRAPTRAEAAVMLVRLLGQEDAALALEYTAPFDDVPQWVQPYVSYLYNNGLTTGVSATKYAPNDICTAQSYATFLLRALGYDDVQKGDFAWNTALDFAAEKAVIDYVNYDPASFLRDHMVAMSFTALSRPTADGKYGTLLEQLIASGAVDRDKAADTVAFFAACAKCDEASAALNGSFAATAKMTTTYTYGSESYAMDSNIDLKIILDQEKLDNTKMEMVTTMSVEDESYTATVYYANGYYYYIVDEDGFKIPMSIEEAMGTIYSQLNLNYTGAEVTPVTFYTSYTPVGRGDGTSAYAFTCSADMLDNMTSQLAGTGVAINKIELTMVLDSDGALASEIMKMDMAVTAEGETVQTTTEMTMTITATGDAVTITLPANLDSYPELIGEADGPTGIML